MVQATERLERPFDSEVRGLLAILAVFVQVIAALVSVIAELAALNLI